MSALAALGARAAGGLDYGESYDDPTAKMMSKLLASSGGDHALAAKAAWNQRERNRRRINQAGGQSLLQVENETRFGGGDPQMLQASMRLKNLATSGGKTQGTFGRTPDPRENDPRLSVQGRAELDRIGAARAGQHGKIVSQAMSAADTEARNIRERTRMQTEGDAWLAEQRRKGQALTALAAR